MIPAFVLCVVLQETPAGTVAPATTEFLPAPVRVADVTALDTAVAAHRGQVVLVSFWATWCKPCVAELPLFRRLYERYARSGLRILGFSLDDPAIAETELTAFLKKHRVPYPVYVVDLGDDPDRVIQHFEGKITGALPELLVYDRQGRIAAAHTGEVTRETELLALLRAGGWQPAATPAD